ncbi:recombinase family protein [Roseomonas sp. HF4]|uniref:recombinase family protein n=1 Tax=Roseomonas sp. HF4 TaxID=2562313 RepID=UPI0035157924
MRHGRLHPVLPRLGPPHFGPAHRVDHRVGAVPLQATRVERVAQDAVATGWTAAQGDVVPGAAACTVRADRESWQIVGTFTDAAISGATMLRPGYQALLAAMRAGEVDIVLAESLDRFSRDLEHVAAFHKAAMFCRVRIVTLSEGEVSDLHVGLKGTMGQLYLKDLKAKTLRGQEGRIRQGRAIGGPPYGYRVVRRLGADGEPERGLREVDPDQARVVRRIYEAYVVGTSPLAIVRALNRDGVPAPRPRRPRPARCRAGCSSGRTARRGSAVPGRARAGRGRPAMPARAPRRGGSPPPRCRHAPGYP